jgi:hypothetical protein
MTEQWGPGNVEGVKAFDKVMVGNEEIELIFGHHPHSRKDNNIYGRTKSGDVEGFDGHRAPVTISIEEYTYLKTSGMSGNQYRKGCRTKLSISGQHVYTLGQGRDYTYALTRLPDVIVRLHEHPIQFWKPEEVRKLEGRKVWYKDQAAEIRRWSPDNGVWLVPVGAKAFRTPSYAQNERDEHWQDEYGQGLYIDVLSESIYWFRD